MHIRANTAYRTIHTELKYLSGQHWPMPTNSARLRQQSLGAVLPDHLGAINSVEMRFNTALSYITCHVMSLMSLSPTCYKGTYTSWSGVRRKASNQSGDRRAPMPAQRGRYREQAVGLKCINQNLGISNSL